MKREPLRRLVSGTGSRRAVYCDTSPKRCSVLSARGRRQLRTRHQLSETSMRQIGTEPWSEPSFWNVTCMYVSNVVPEPSRRSKIVKLEDSSTSVASGGNIDSFAKFPTTTAKRSTLHMANRKSRTAYSFPQVSALPSSIPSLLSKERTLSWFPASDVNESSTKKVSRI
jgi:hypothetical protein